MVLTDAQLKDRYFWLDNRVPEVRGIREIKDYCGEELISVWCTQLDFFRGYTKQDEKRILQEWIDFLTTNTTALKGIYFQSCVPQALFNAVCCQENLEELYLKWGYYSDLSALNNLKSLRYLFIGGRNSRIQDISVLRNMNSLVSLTLEALSNIEDYSLLVNLESLEQLAIKGSPGGTRTPMKDFDFIRNMKNLRSIWLAGVNVRKKYSTQERELFRSELPDLYDENNFVFRTKTTN